LPRFKESEEFKDIATPRMQEITNVLEAVSHNQKDKTYAFKIWEVAFATWRGERLLRSCGY
jgi:hypothetical protein